MQTNYLLLVLFFWAIYLCSSIVPALAPSEVKNTRKQILLLLKLTTAATVFLLASNYSNYIIGTIIAALVLVILYLVKDTPSVYYALPALVGLSIISNNYYILTCMTTTLFLKGMADYSDIKKIRWSDKRLSMFIYLIITSVVVILLTSTIQIATV